MKNLIQLIVISLIFGAQSTSIFGMDDEIKERSEKVVQTINPKQIRTRDKIADCFNELGIKPSMDLANIIASYVTVFTPEEVCVATGELRKVHMAQGYLHSPDDNSDYDIRSIKEALEEGADIDSQSINLGLIHRATILMRAIEYERVKIVEFLIKLGVNIHIKDENNDDAIGHCAKYSFNARIIELLIKAKADIKKYETLLLMKAIHRGKKSLVDLLLKAGADPNKRYPRTSIYDSFSELTPLEYANDPEIEQMLIDAMGETSADIEDEEEFCV